MLVHREQNDYSFGRKQNDYSFGL